MTLAVVVNSGDKLTVTDETHTLELTITERNWELAAACADAKPSLFVSNGDEPNEPNYPSKEAKAYCDRCWVKDHCLNFAIKSGIEYGVWGGLSTHQRKQIKRIRPRKHCPGCGAQGMIVKELRHELCLGCGISWNSSNS